MTETGLTRSVVIRNFAKSFNKAKGFPYDVSYPVSEGERESVVEMKAEMKARTAKSCTGIYEMPED